MKKKRIILVNFMIPFLIFTCGQSGPGEFENNTDIGQISLQGSVKFDSGRQQYLITGSGENIWGTQDAFHFLWRQVSGDVTLSTNVVWPGENGHEHRKAGWMIRQSLDPDAPYIDAVIHGDGLTSLQYRKQKGGPTFEIKSTIQAPELIMLERHGDLFTLSVAETSDMFHPVGSTLLTFNDPVYTGLVVCSHDSTKRETAMFSNVKLESAGVYPDSVRVLESTLETIEITTGKRHIVHRVKDHIEAPNWAPDGRNLIFNSQGSLYSISVAGGTPEKIPSGEANRCNNDHGFSPDSKLLALSHNTEGRGSLIYVIPASGGEPRLVTEQGPSYWHGWSPDGKTLAYCARRNNEYDIYTIPIDGGKEKRLTTAAGLDDGPDYSPDNKYIYFNSERTGSMKIWRMLTNGKQQEQVTFDEEYADWFPHPSPDGKWIVFLSYDKSVQGHPANKQVTLRIMPVTGGQPRILTHLFGGQGTINVPSWSPDSQNVAFVSYRLLANQQ